MNLNYNLFKNLISLTFILLSIIMIPSILVAHYYNEVNVTFSMSIIAVIYFFIGLFINIKSNRKSIKSTIRDGYLTTFFVWLALVFASALPYYFSNSGYYLSDCIFESAAGWSTTGAFVIHADILPKGLLFWKATNNWFGGIGMIMLIISLTPYFNISGQKLIVAEAPGPTLEKMSTKFTGTARYLYFFYLILTLLEFIMLKYGGLSLYDAAINTMSGISTAGIHLNSGGISYNLTTFNKTVVTIFTFLAATNFGIYFFLFKGKFEDILGDLEFRVYILLTLASTIVIYVALINSDEAKYYFEDFLHSISMAISFISTSGYSFTDYSIWPSFAKVILIICMFIGGCSISTAGGIKISRIIVFYKLILRGIYKRIHPRSVKPVSFFKKPISVNNVFTIMVYILLYFVIFLIGSLLLSLDNLSMETTLSATIGAMSNTGLSFGELANVADYSIFSHPARILLSILMIGGRLEFYAIALLFSKHFWNTNIIK